jgi:hypothetical protein
MRPLLALAVALATTQAEATIFRNHEELRSLLPHTENLMVVIREIDALAPSLEREISQFAAVEARADAELLLTTSSMILQFHAALVQVYAKTGHFDETYLNPSLEVLAAHAKRTEARCTRLLQVIERPDLVRNVFKLQTIARTLADQFSTHLPGTDES